MVQQLAAELGLTVVARLVGGEHGAIAVATPNGTQLVLKTFGLADEARLRRAIDCATRMRSRGIPVPDPYRVGTTRDRCYTLQRRCPGEVPQVLQVAHAEQLLELWTAHRDAAPEGSDWPDAAIAALTVGNLELWADHRPIRGAGGDAAALLDEIVAVGNAGDPRLLRSTDVMHGDWHHRNLLAIGDRITTIIDWESSRPGDARFDLVYLEYYTAVYDGSGVATQAAARVRGATAERVEPDARRLLAALVALHQLWFVSALRPERLPQTVEQVHRHLAPSWRSR